MPRLSLTSAGGGGPAEVGRVLGLEGGLVGWRWNCIADLSACVLPEGVRDLLGKCFPAGSGQCAPSALYSHAAIKVSHADALYQQHIRHQRPAVAVAEACIHQRGVLGEPGGASGLFQQYFFLLQK